MQCPKGCRSEMKAGKEEKIFRRNGKPVVISNLIVYVCPDCEQEFMPLSSARIVEDILNGKIKPSGQFTAELYNISSFG